MKVQGLMKVIETDWGVAYTYDDIIEINPVLYKYPGLLAKIIEHEYHHNRNKTADIRHDLKELLKFDIDYIRFCFRHPIISLQSLAPVWYHNKEWNINIFLCILYSIILIGIGFFLKLR